MSDWLIDELQTICSDVSRGFSTSGADTYITIQLLHSEPAEYKENSFEQMQSKYRIHLFSKTDYTQMQADIIRLLRRKAYEIGVEAEFYEQDTGYYHAALYCTILEEI